LIIGGAVHFAEKALKDGRRDEISRRCGLWVVEVLKFGRSSSPEKLVQLQELVQLKQVLELKNPGLRGNRVEHDLDSIVVHDADVAYLICARLAHDSDLSHEVVIVLHDVDDELGGAPGAILAPLAHSELDTGHTLPGESVLH